MLEEMGVSAGGLSLGLVRCFVELGFRYKARQLSQHAITPQYTLCTHRQIQRFICPRSPLFVLYFFPHVSIFALKRFPNRSISSARIPRKSILSNRILILITYQYLASHCCLFVYLELTNSAEQLIQKRNNYSEFSMRTTCCFSQLFKMRFHRLLASTCCFVSQNICCVRVSYNHASGIKHKLCDSICIYLKPVVLQWGFFYCFNNDFSH